MNRNENNGKRRSAPNNPGRGEKSPLRPAVRNNAENRTRGETRTVRREVHKTSENANENNTPRKDGRSRTEPGKRLFRGADVRQNDFIKRPDVVRVRGGIDRTMLIIIILMLCFGSVMVFSASYATARNTEGDSFFYIKKQIIFATLGIIAMCGIGFLDYRVIRKLVPVTFIAAAVLLFTVLVAGISQGVAQRWLVLGPISFQPSEVMKPVLALFLANYFAHNQDKVTNYRDFKQSSIWGDLIPALIVGFVCIEVALEKHLSGTIIMFLIGVVIIFCGGARKFWIFLTGGGGAALVGIVYAATPYVRKRVDIFLHPEKYDALDETMQTIQGLNAVGNGGLLGVGLGNSYQKYSFVPMPQNDFIFSIVCEELGFVGALAVIALFVLFIWRGFVIAMKAPDTFSSLAVIGIVAHVAIQAILNIAVVTAMIPNTGITLPFFSYGGSALVILMAEMGVVLAISRYSYKED